MANMGSIVFSLALVLSIQFVAGQDEQTKDSATSELSFIEAAVENAKKVDSKLADVTTDDIKGMGREIQKTLESKGVNDKDLDEALTLAQDENAIENGLGSVGAPEPGVAEEIAPSQGVGEPEPGVAEEITPSPEVLPELADDAADVPEEEDQ